MVDAVKAGHVADRPPGPPAAAMASASELLRDIVAHRGLAVSKDLVGDIGGTTTHWKLNNAQTLIVASIGRDAAIDDAFECGRIAAAAALSAIHAFAARPLFARLTCACPAAASDAAKAALIEGVAVAMAAAGAVLADAQWVDAPALRFDVVVAGVVRPDRAKGPVGARPDDALVLAGALGAGIYAAAHAKQRLVGDDRDVLIARATQTGAFGIELGAIRNVHAIAEVGPDGFVAALLALAEASSLHASIASRRVPALSRALALAKSGVVAAASSRNWNRDGARVDLADAVMPEMRALLTDPAPGGTLLIACKPQSVERVIALAVADGGEAAQIGALSMPADDTSPPRRRVTIG